MILVREIGVTLLRFWVIRHGVIPASRGGKAKTAAQMLAILLYLLPVTGWLLTARVLVMALALVLTVVTGVDYCLRACGCGRLPRDDRRRPRPLDARLRAGRVGRAGVGRAAPSSTCSSPAARPSPWPSRSRVASSGAPRSSVPGASAVFRGGVVAYITDLKASLLGVDPALLAREGAVHPDVAAADGSRRRRPPRGDVGLATTGVAGPDPQDGRPVGEVCVAVAGPAGRLVSGAAEIGIPDGTDPAAVRPLVRTGSVAAALTLLAAQLDA